MASADNLVATDPDILRHRSVTGPAQRLSLTPEQTFYQFCIQEGICALNGTTNPEHMQLGVQVAQGKAGQLTEKETQQIRKYLY